MQKHNSVRNRNIKLLKLIHIQGALGVQRKDWIILSQEVMGKMPFEWVLNNT